MNSPNASDTTKAHTNDPSLTRCSWVTTDPLYIAYHDQEWGVPVHDDHHLFEMLILEGAQAGLSWLTVLKKRDQYRVRFHQFEIQAVADMSDEQLAACLADPGIVRNRLKVHATRTNARVALSLIREHGSLDHYLWSFVNHQPIINHLQPTDRPPATSPQSDAMSKALKKAGMTFVGSTICYAFMQAVGMVNDHTTTCPWHPDNRPSPRPTPTPARGHF